MMSVNSLNILVNSSKKTKKKLASFMKEKREAGTERKKTFI